jgi:hypothetical protein
MFRDTVGYVDTFNDTIVGRRDEKMKRIIERRSVTII